MTVERRYDVIVVGGGFAGLSAATMLAEAGARVLVLEARPQLGGRATAFVDRHTGELVDNGQHVLFGCYRATFEFLRRIGAGQNVTRQSTLQLACYDRSGVRHVLRCPRWPPPLHLLGGVLGWQPIPWRDRLRVFRVVPALLAARNRRSWPHPSSADVETVDQWLDKHHQGPVLREWLWEPLAVAALNQSVHRAAAAPFVRVLAEMFSRDPSAAALVLPAKPLHEMYAEPARDYVVARGGDVRTSAVARLSRSDGGPFAVQVRETRLEADVVISAVAWHSLPNLFGGAVPTALTPLVSAASRMTSEPIVTVNLWYDRAVLTDAFAGLPGRTMQWVFEKRLVFGGAASHLSLVSSGATEIAARSSDELVALAVREVSTGLPGAREARLLRATVVRERRATFSLAPGQPRRPGTETAIEGLFIAGDWTDTGLPATIESAVISGHAAARAALGRAPGAYARPETLPPVTTVAR